MRMGQEKLGKLIRLNRNKEIKLTFNAKGNRMMVA